MRKGKDARKNTTGLKVVLDTNVYISAFNDPNGSIAPIWEHARSITYHLVVSPAIINEVARVLRHYFAWDEIRIRTHLKRILSVAETVVPSIVPSDIEDDPDDNHILACALAGNANLIVSGDNHLRRLKVYKGIAIVQPSDFLHTLEGFEAA